MRTLKFLFKSWSLPLMIAFISETTHSCPLPKTGTTLYSMLSRTQRPQHTTLKMPLNPPLCWLVSYHDKCLPLLHDHPYFSSDACLNVQGPRKGLIILFDMKGVSLFHLMRTNISGLRKFFHYLQECLPCKLHRIHVMNVVPFFDAILKLIKPFMKAELLQMVGYKQFQILKT